MRRAVYAIFLTTLVASSSQAGYVGTINLSTGSGINGSLTTNAANQNQLVGTNLQATSYTSAGGTVSPLTGAYFDFQTGVQTSSDASGNATYSATSSNFFVLNGLLPAANGTPPVASSLTTGAATVINTGTYDTINNVQYQIFELTETFSGGYLSQVVSTAFGQNYVPLPDGRIYTGTLDLTFIGPNISSLAGNQLLGGTLTFNSVPEPSSLVMVVIGGLGLAGYGRRQLRQRRAA